MYSYVVDHDLGFAPNPEANYCTLVHCKFGGEGGRRNIVELADLGDWILGTGGESKDSVGNGKVVYLMRVDEKPTFQKFLSDRRFQGRFDCQDCGRGNRFALISQKYFYFGRNAPSISSLPKQLARNLEKKGPGYRRDYPADLLPQLVRWFERKYLNGMHGDPCGNGADTRQPRMRANCAQ